MGQTVTSLLENKYSRQYAQIVGRLPDDDDDDDNTTTHPPRSQEYTLVSLEVYQRLKRIDRKSTKRQQDQADFDYCQRCSVMVSDHTLPYLRVSHTYIVCFRCYARDRLHHLASYLLLASQVFPASIAVVAEYSLLLHDVTPLLLSMMRRVLSDANTSIMREKLYIDIAHVGVNDDEGTLRDLWAAGFVAYWHQSFSVVACEGGKPFAAYVVGRCEHKQRELRVYYADRDDEHQSWKWDVSGNGYLVCTADHQNAFVSIWRAVLWKQRDIGGSFTVYPYDVTTQQQTVVK